MKDKPFKCSRGCLTTLGGVKGFSQFKNWKRHMTDIHGGASPEELEAANALIGTVHTTTRSQGELDIDADPDAKARREAKAPEPDEKEKARIAQAKRVNKEINERFEQTKHLMFTGVPAQLFGALARAQDAPEFRLSEGESKLIEEGFETLMLALGINWEIEPINVTVKSPIWLLLYPLAIMATIFLGKKSAVDKRKRSEAESVAPTGTAVP